MKYDFFSLDLYSFRNYFYWNEKKNTEIATEIFWIGKFHFEWYQKGFTERSIWQPLPDWRSTQSFSVLFCIQEDSNPPNRIKNLNLFTEANKPSNRGSPVESDSSHNSLQIIQEKLLVCLYQTCRGVLWFTEGITAEFNFNENWKMWMQTFSWKKYLKELSEINSITYRILLQQMH